MSEIPHGTQCECRGGPDHNHDLVRCIRLAVRTITVERTIAEAVRGGHTVDVDVEQELYYCADCGDRHDAWLKRGALQEGAA